MKTAFTLAFGAVMMAACALLAMGVMVMLYGVPWVYVPLVLWLGFVEYALGCAWWQDVRYALLLRRTGRGWGQ